MGKSRVPGLLCVGFAELFVFSIAQPLIAIDRKIRSFSSELS
jgi:hypothetical protein